MTIGQFPEHLDKTEARIINKLITEILKHGDRKLVARIYDGETWASDWTRDRAELQRCIASTDETRISIADVAGPNGFTRVGAVFLIHGNGEDVISDMGWSKDSKAHEAIMNAICDQANGHEPHTGGCGDPVDWHAEARAFMERRPELRAMSLDEWLTEHFDKLTRAEYDEGVRLLQNFSGFGGEA